MVHAVLYQVVLQDPFKILMLHNISYNLIIRSYPTARTLMDLIVRLHIRLPEPGICVQLSDLTISDVGTYKILSPAFLTLETLFERF